MPTTLSLVSTARVESTIHPGVFFVLKKRTERRRIALRMKLTESTAKLDAVLAEIRAFGPAPHKGIAEDQLTAEQKAEVAAWIEATNPLVNRYTTLLDDEIHPAWVEWGLARIEGVDVDGEEITGKNAVDLLPEDLYQEVLGAIQDTAQLGGAREKNSSLPITSDAAADGQTPDTTA